MILFLLPPTSASKTLFLGMRLGEIFLTMSFTKSVPKRLMLLEYERGAGGKNSPIRYIPEKDPVQEALEKNKMTNYFKLTLPLPHMGSKLKVSLWASGTPKQLILHVCSANHTCKQMEHDIKSSKAKEADENEILDLEIKKEEYVQVHSPEREKTKGNQGKAYLLPLCP